MRLKKQAIEDPEKFEREHSAEAAAAYSRCEEHYKSMALWRRSDLRNLCRENWPDFVDVAS